MYEYAQNQFKENEFVLRMADVKQIHTLLMRHEKGFGFYTKEYMRQIDQIVYDLYGLTKEEIKIAEDANKDNPA